MTNYKDIKGINFENIVDTGTEGTRVATGTTAQQGNTQGLLRFNTDKGALEYRGVGGFFDIDETPSISSSASDRIITSSGGTTTVTINGGNFITGMNVKAIGTDNSEITADSVTVVNRGQMTAVFTDSNFSNAVEPYTVKVINPNGRTAELSGQIQVDTAPTFTTPSGNVAEIGMTETGTHATLQATDAEGDAITFSEVGSVLSGINLSLNSDGTISGDPTDVTNATTYNFTARATAGTLFTDRAFNIIVKKDYAEFLGHSFFLANTNGDTNQTINIPVGTKSIAYTSSLFFNNGGKQVSTPSVNGNSFTKVGNHYTGNSTYGADAAGYIINYTGSGNTTFTFRTNNTSGHNYKMGGVVAFFDLEFANIPTIHDTLSQADTENGTLHSVLNGAVIVSATNDGNRQGMFGTNEFTNVNRNTGDGYRHYTQGAGPVTSSNASTTMTVNNGAGDHRAVFGMSLAPTDFSL